MKTPSLTYLGAVSVVSALWLFASLSVALWGTLVVLVLLFAVPPVLLVTSTLTLLGAVMLSQLLPAWSAYSEQLATYAFYLLCVSVLAVYRAPHDGNGYPNNRAVILREKYMDIIRLDTHNEREE